MFPQSTRIWPFLVALLALAAILLTSGIAEGGQRHLGPHYNVEATAYAPCAGSVGVGTMRYGREVYTGAVASNFLPAKALVKLDHPIRTTDMLGRSKLRRWFRVEDTGASFDIWMANCDEAWTWGRRTIGIRLVTR